MRIDRHIALSAGWVAGPAFGVAMMAMPLAFDLSRNRAFLLFWSGIGVFVVTLLVVFVVSAREREQAHMAVGPVVLMALGLLIFGGGAVWFLWPGLASAVPPSKPDTTAELSSIGDEKLPGFGAICVVQINDALAFRRKFLFSVGDQEGAEIGFYLSKDDVFKFTVKDINNENYTLDISLGKDGIPLYSWVVISFDVGTASNYSFLRVSLNGIILSERKFPFRLALGSRNWKNIAFGADQDGAQAGAFVMGEFGTTSATLTHDEITKLVANARAFYKF